MQGGGKPSTSCGVEKSSLDPPTANIKPMAGPSSTVTKQQPVLLPLACLPPPRVVCNYSAATPGPWT